MKILEYIHFKIQSIQLYATMLKTYYENGQQLTDELLNQLKEILPLLLSSKSQLCSNFGPLQNYVNDLVTCAADISGQYEQSLKFFLQQKQYQKAAGIAMRYAEKIEDFEKRAEILSIAVACCNITESDAIFSYSKQVRQNIIKEAIDTQINKLQQDPQNKQQELDRLNEERNKFLQSNIKALSICYTQDEVKQQFIYAQAMSQIKSNQNLSVSQLVNQLLQQGYYNMALTIIKTYKMSSSIFIQAVCKQICQLLQHDILQNMIPIQKPILDTNIQIKIKADKYNENIALSYKNGEILNQLFNYLFVSIQMMNDGQGNLLLMNENNEIEAFISFIIAANDTQEPIKILAEVEKIWVRISELKNSKHVIEGLKSLLEVTEIQWIGNYIQIPNQIRKQVQQQIVVPQQPQFKQQKNAFERINQPSKFQQQHDLNLADLQPQVQAFGNMNKQYNQQPKSILRGNQLWYNLNDKIFSLQIYDQHKNQENLQLINQQFIKQLPNKQQIQCLACNHYCKINLNKSGICGIRFNINNHLQTKNYNHPIAVAIDPIEKKPLHHFLPGSQILSIGTVGCNFHCNFCQNWEISQVNQDLEDQLNTYDLTPQQIINLCLKKKLDLIAFTYNEPTTFIEYNLEICKLAKQKGIRTVYVSNGYMSKEVSEILAQYISAINIDLKCFTQQGYQSLGGDLKPVCDNIEYFYKHNVIVEVTTLVVPGFNDSDEEIQNIAKFLSNISCDIPWHLSAFHPDYKLLDVERTKKETLLRCQQIGKQHGLKYIYVGNIAVDDNNTKCPKCNKVVIKRDYIGKNIGIDKQTNKCKNCQTYIYGIFQ